MDVYAKIAVKIIQSQEDIIGPVAVEQARQVSGLQIDWDEHKITISGDEATIIDQLIDKYQQLFGQISVEVSRDAVSALVGQLPADGLPEALK